MSGIKYASALFFLFDGNPQAHGIFKLLDEKGPGGKVKAQIFTRRNNVTTTLWEQHLSGTQGLGIVPIHPDGKVKFCAIDIDVYGKSHQPLLDKIKEFNLPLIPCLTKSGGLHLFIFFCSWVPAKKAVEKTRTLASTLGLSGKCEIFPKQTKLHAKEVDTGNWITMPYFGNLESHAAVSLHTGEPVPLEKFLNWAKDKKLSQAEFDQIKEEEVQADDDPWLKDGPPCLNKLAAQKLGRDQGRNQVLFDVYTMARKIFPDDENAQKQYVIRFNKRYFSEPLPEEEVKSTILKARDKEYTYRCDSNHLSPWCNKDACKTRLYGIGLGGVQGLPVIGSCVEVKYAPPVFVISIEGSDERVTLSADCFVDYRKYQIAVVEATGILPTPITNKIWQAYSTKVLEKRTMVYPPAEMTPLGKLCSLVSQFCESAIPGAININARTPWIADNGDYMFRYTNFVAWLRANRAEGNEFKSDARLAELFKQLGIQSTQTIIDGKAINVWRVRGDFADIKASLAVPDIPSDEPF